MARKATISRQTGFYFRALPQVQLHYVGLVPHDPVARTCIRFRPQTHHILHASTLKLFLKRKVYGLPRSLQDFSVRGFK